MERELKVLHLNTWSTGGAGEACRRINNALLKEGIVSNILFLRCENEKNNEHSFKNSQSKLSYSLKMLLLRGLSFLPTLFKPKAYFNSLYSPFDVTKHPLFQESDIIHLHWVCKFVNWKKVLNCGKPLVITMHDMYPITGSYHFKTGLKFSCYDKLIGRRRRKLQKMYANAKVYPTAPSQWLTDVANKSSVFNVRAKCIPNCIDTSIYNPKKNRNLNEVVKILFVAENVNDSRKGFNILLNALKRLPENIQYELHILGNNGNVFLPNSKSLGFISNPELLVSTYQEADVFIIPSLEDNLPNTVLEALACGTSVVGFNIGGVPDMVSTGENGYLANELNEESLSKQIEKSIVKPLNNRKAVFLADKFTEKSVSKSYINLYNTILSREI